MKKCEYEGCQATVDERYRYCFEHYKSPNKVVSTAAVAENLWHPDPVVDALRKINANLGSILQELRAQHPVGEEKKPATLQDYDEGE